MAGFKLSAFPEAGFTNYWYSAGALPSVKAALFGRNCDLDLTNIDRAIVCSSGMLTGGIRLKADDVRQTLEPDFDPALMLYQAGYLTIRQAQETQDDNSGDITLGITNREIRQSLRTALKKRTASGLQADDINELRYIKNALTSSDLQRIAEIFTCYLNSWICDNSALDSENACRRLIAAWLEASGLDVISEAHSAGDRFDILLTLPAEHLRYASELKMLHRRKTGFKTH